MSLTLAFSAKIPRELFQPAVSNVCRKFDYGVSFSLKNAQAHVYNGVEAVMFHLQDTEIAFIHAPNTDLQEAPLIAKQLIEGGDKTLGLAFFEDIATSLFLVSDSFSVMFAVEDWSSNQAIRFIKGSMDEFMKLLSKECSWCIEVFHPKSNSWSCHYDYPLVFEIRQD